ncbi:MAG: ionic transporter y4hA, partial [Flavitalea sp.]
MKLKLPLPLWTIIAPIFAWLLFLFKSEPLSTVYAIFLALLLIAAVMAAVHHAEVVAHRVGEPYG